MAGAASSAGQPASTFVGAEATRSHLIAEVEVTEETPTGIRYDDAGIHGINVMEDGRTVGIVVTEQQVGPATEPTLADLRAALRSVYGTDFGIHDPSWISRFTDATRQAATYRRGRVLLAGDAAHTHPPTGGQGIGLGVQDAVNLGWKLGQVVRGVSPEALLDTYHAERHPVTARVLRNVMTQALLQRGDARTEALRDTIAEMLGFDGPRTQLAGLLSGLDVAYDLGEGHPLLGRRMPDLDLATAQGPQRVFELLHDARAVLLNLGEPGSHRHQPVGGARPAGRRRPHRDVGATRRRNRQRTDGRVDPARRSRRVGRQRHGDGTQRSLDDLVWTAEGCHLLVLTGPVDRGSATYPADERPLARGGQRSGRPPGSSPEPPLAEQPATVGARAAGHQATGID